MPTKKKKFIDKKNAKTFHLVHRSQKDPLVADELAPKHVLLFSSSKETKADEQKRKEQQRKFGIYFDDDYNYLQHLKDVDLIPDWEPILERVRIDNELSTENEEFKLKLPSSVFQSSVEEKVGLLNKAAPCKGPRPDWDPDIVAALDDDFKFDNPENELEDNFVAIANDYESDDDLTEGREGDDEMENFDDISSDEAEFERNEFFDRENFFIEEETRSRFTNYSLTSSYLPRSENLQFLDERFEKLYEQYDDDEIGTLDHEEICGYIQPNSTILTQLAEEFEKNQKTSTLEEFHKQHESKNNDETDDSTESNDIIRIEENDKENRWDCESIISTYSTSSNHPRLISEPKKEIIKISQKTGLPVNILANRGLTKQQLRKLQKTQLNNSYSSDDDDDKCIDESATYSKLSIASTVRSKTETPEERRVRKGLVKQMRKERRIEKKCNKMAFKEEKKRQEKIAQNITYNLQAIKLV